MKKSEILKNVVTGFGGQIIVIILGIVIPRIIIKSYGSDVNGLVSTVTQIFTYMALLEAGIGQATRNALYMPIANMNKELVSDVVSTSNAYFRKGTIYYALGVIALSFLSPYILNTNVDKVSVIFIVLFEGASDVVTFYFIQTPSILLNADGKGYVNHVINLTNKIIAYGAKIVFALLGVNIVLLQLIYLIITILKVLVYKLYFKKKYKWISFHNKPKFELLKDRKSFVLTEIAWTIFSSTDMIVLSIFINTKLSSVYSVYNMIFSNISVLLNTVAGSILYVLGQAFFKNKDEYEIIHDSFTSFFLGIITIFMAVSYVLIIPFVRLYTDGIADINYVYDALPIMFCLIQIFSWSRYVSGNLTALAGYAKQTSYISLLEAVTNIILSIVLVRKYGIIGVTLATVIALPIKVIWCLYISDRKILKRSCSKSLSIIGINFLMFFLVVVVSNFYTPSIDDFTQFILWGVFYSLLFGSIGVYLNCLVNKNCWNVIKRYFFKP